MSDKPFPPDLVAEVEGLTLPQGSFQPIPITVTRAGTTGPIKLKLLGVPAGVKITPDEISEKENVVVCKLQADITVPIGVHSLQILAETSSRSTLVRTQPMIDRQIINVDLIPLALREDQRRLPPSLTDRFALQITPAAPFTMELPEPIIATAPLSASRHPYHHHSTTGFRRSDLVYGEGRPTRGQERRPNPRLRRISGGSLKNSRVVGSIHSKILSNIGKTLIEVTGSTTYQGRRISLTRTFELNLISAFSITAEPTKVSLLPGESAKVRFAVSRVKSFSGDVILKLSPMQGIEFPESVTIPKDQTGTKIVVKIPMDTTPRQQKSAGGGNRDGQRIRGRATSRLADNRGSQG